MVALLETVGDNPAFILHSIQFHRLQADFLLRVEQQHLSGPGAVALESSLRHADTLTVDGLLQSHAHEAAWQQVEVRVGNLAAQGDLAGARVDGDVGEQIGSASRSERVWTYV